MAGEAHFEVFPETSDGVIAETQETVSEPTGKYRWRFQAANGKLLATSGEGFESTESATRAIHDFLDDVDPEGAGTDRTHAPIVDVAE